jgi:hypothetical protein
VEPSNSVLEIVTRVAADVPVTNICHPRERFCRSRSRRGRFLQEWGVASPDISRVEICDKHVSWAGK